MLIPRDIIEMKTLPPIRISVFIHLSRKRPLDDNVYTSINKLITSSGYVPDIHKNRTTDKFITTLDTLEGLEYFKKIDGDYVGNKLCELQLNRSKFDIQKSFAYVSLYEVDTLVTYKGLPKSTSPDKLLLLLTYIRVNKLRRSTNQQSNPKKKPEFFYRHINQISDDLVLSTKTITNCIQVLEDLDIIASHPMPRYKDKYDRWHTDVTLFVDKINDWEQELRWGEEFLLKGRILNHNDNQS